MPAPKDTPYSEAEVAARLAMLTGWTLEAGWLSRTYVTGGWAHTLLVVNAIGFAAEAADHHPDLAVSWARVVVRLQTHSAGGLTGKDFELARRLDDVVLWRPEGGALRGPSRPIVRPDQPA